MIFRGHPLGRKVRLYGIDQTAPLAQAHIQFAVHARTTQHVVQEVKGGTFLITGIVRPAT